MFNNPDLKFNANGTIILPEYIKNEQKARAENERQQKEKELKEIELKKNEQIE